MNRVALLGSVNMSLTINVERLPRPGESAVGEGELLSAGGGGGGSAAVAMARLGVEVHLIGAVGDDEYGDRIAVTLEREGVNIDHLHRIPGAATGVAHVTVDAEGNSISATAPGANRRVSMGMVEAAAGLLDSATLAVTQFEVPLDSVRGFLEAARGRGAATLLDPSPPIEVPEEIIGLADFITPNEAEAEWFWGRPLRVEHDAFDCVRDLSARVRKAAVLTRGRHGFAFCERGGEPAAEPGLEVRTVDSTGAGDAFVGGFCYGLLRGDPPLEAARYANLAAAISTARRGAMPSPPSCDEVMDFKTACTGRLGPDPDKQ